MNAPLLSRPVGLRVADLDDAIERARIGAFVHDHADGTPFHLPAWSIAVARGCGQTNHYLVAEGGNGQLAGVMPLTEVHSPLFGRALVSAAFGVGGGILADNPRVAAELAEAAWALAGRLSCPVMEVRGGPLPGPEWHVDTTRYIGFARDLAADDDAELLAIPRKQRAEVRKSLEIELEVAVGSDEREQAEHYAVYAESVRNLGTPVFPKSLFSEVLREFGKSADLLIIRESGVAVSSVLSLYWNGTVYPYWGGGTRAARALRANDRMYFELMRHARTRGCTRFDFGRSKTGTGAAAFKKNWGFEPMPLTYYERVAEGAKARDASPANPKFSLQVKVWSKLPLAVANRVGPWISRGLG
ncbi:MAG: FemAB family PEP-CTERM system-associated protein [Sphingomonas sp.]|uniref:FemAB family XrtA/PEP-CTERM system-associated protein n=1 Tax=Sphingomonas sp. TaxID=28214 RepID=UPI0025F6A66E|nr:FemAB family XrtA/PEP-CTERM system-associated protein [Sphingomonas sp.]MBX3565043.1 FemAB family PEP-CTERM system-associated protein [Sphingomonas sp.]